MSSSGEPTVVNDRYEIERRVGRGGMADVFLARDLLLDRQVAIKVLFPEFAVDPNFVERFRREAQAAANLSHPNIVNVYDWGKHSGTYFITMEYVQGRTLAEILRTNKQLTPKQAAEIASEVAAALGFAHEADLAHRDIKPANILIGTNGQVKVADFGIARAMNATEANLTQAGAVMGTASYFSPEQAQGAQPDPRSDLYSLGIVMYEMVAGRPPFSGENPVSIAYKQVHDAPTPLNRIVEGIPRPFEAIVAKLLAKDPKLRYPSAVALRDDLRRFRNGEQVQALVAAAAGTVRPVPPTERAVTGSQATQAATTVAPSAAPVVAAPVTGTAATAAMPRTGAHPMSHYPPGASPEAHYYEEGPSRTGWYALAAFVALIALIAGGVLLFQALSNDDDETVGIFLDDYTNQPLETVTAALDLLEIPYQSIAEENALFPENFVHRTDPVAGTLIPPTQLVRLYFNPTAQLVPVPDVRGRSLDDAQRILGAEGFTTDAEFEESDVAEGFVIRTEPAANEPVGQDTLIMIVVSAGLDTVNIPPVIIGNRIDVARDLLENEPFGLVVVEEPQEDPDIAAGLVITSRPSPNTQVERGSTVTLVVSSGPGQVSVPPLVGLTEGQARNQLAQNGLQANVSFTELPPGDANDGLVVSQDPTAANRIDRGSTVAFVVGQARAPETTTTTTVPPTTTTVPPTTTTVPPTTTTEAPTTTAAPDEE